MEIIWKEFTPKVRAFNYDDDAYKISTGRTEILSKNDIIEKYKILF